MKDENFGNTNLKALFTTFDFAEKEVKRGFWKYCKSFARLNNLKKYYEVIIPASENEGNVDVRFLAKIHSPDDKTILAMSPVTDDVPDRIRDKYLAQSRKLLLDFKQEFYSVNIQSEIDALIKKSKKLSGRYQRMKKKGKGSASEQKVLLDSVSEIDHEIRLLRSELFEINSK